MALLYLDTNVLIDAAENRRNIFGKNVGNAASDLLTASFICKHELIISTLTLEELYKNAENLRAIFGLLKKKISSPKYTEAQEARAKEISSEHWKDALHIIIADREKADYVITRNIDHFSALQQRMGLEVQIRKPESLL